MMALQNALEGSGSAGRAGLSIHFKISLKIKNALYECAFGFPRIDRSGMAFAARPWLFDTCFPGRRARRLAYSGLARFQLPD